jgi:hypothetical protein
LAPEPIPDAGRDRIGRGGAHVWFDEVWFAHAWSGKVRFGGWSDAWLSAGSGKARKIVAFADDAAV